MASFTTNRYIIQYKLNTEDITHTHTRTCAHTHTHTHTHTHKTHVNSTDCVLAMGILKS